MIIALGHRHRLVAGEVVDLLDEDGDLQLVGGGFSVSFEHPRNTPAGSPPQVVQGLFRLIL